MSDTLTRIRVILTAAPTYLVLASTAVATAATEISALLPDRAADITRWVAPLISALSVAVVLMRSVTTVLPEHRNLLSHVPYVPVGVVPPAEEPGVVVNQSPKFDKIP